MLTSSFSNGRDDSSNTTKNHVQELGGSSRWIQAFLATMMCKCTEHKAWKDPNDALVYCLKLAPTELLDCRRWGTQVFLVTCMQIWALFCAIDGAKSIGWHETRVEYSTINTVLNTNKTSEWWIPCSRSSKQGKLPFLCRRSTHAPFHGWLIDLPDLDG